MFLKKFEEFVAWKICKFNMNTMIFTILSHFFPLRGLLFKSFINLFHFKSLKKLIASKHMPSNIWILTFYNFMINLELFQLPTIRVMYKIHSIRSWSRKSSSKNCIPFFIFKNKVEILLVLFIFIILWCFSDLVLRP